VHPHWPAFAYGGSKSSSGLIWRTVRVGGYPHLIKRTSPPSRWARSAEARNETGARHARTGLVHLEPPEQVPLVLYCLPGQSRFYVDDAAPFCNLG
jgi:hypothetical protein